MARPRGSTRKSYRPRRSTKKVRQLFRKFKNRQSVRMGYYNARAMSGEFYIKNTSTGGVATVSPTPTDGLVQIGGPTTITGGWGYNIPFSCQFTAQQIINIAEYQALFDYYRLKKVWLRITYNHNVSTASGTSGLPQLKYVIDYDDSTPISSDALREYRNVKTKTFSPEKRYITIPVQLRCLTRAYQSIVDGYKIEKPSWNDLASSGIVHYGVKGTLENVQLPSVDGTSFFKFEVMYSLELKGQR